MDAGIRRIAVVGAGLSGLAVAVAAAAAGCEVVVYEAAERLPPTQAHIDVVPTMLRGLVDLRVAGACVRQGFAYRGVSVVDPQGQACFEIPTPALAGPQWPTALGMVYRDLLAVLLDQALSLGVRVHWRAPVTHVDVARARPALHADPDADWQGDLVVLAGARGVGGLARPPGARVQRFAQRWDHVMVPRPRAIERTTWVVGPGLQKAIVVPVSVAAAGLALLRAADAEPTLAAVRAEMAARGGLLAGLAAHLAEDAALTCRPVATGLRPAPWHEGGVLCVGGSAHVLPPHFGQAAAQSVEDATVLGDLLGRSLDREALLQHFQARRLMRATGVHAITTQAAQWDLRPEAATDLAALARSLGPFIEAAA